MRRIGGHIFVLIFSFSCLFILSGAAARAQQPGQQAFRSDKALIHADMLTHIPEQNIVVATGNVEIEQNGRILMARKLTYNQVSGVVEATGDVSLLEPDGTVYFADRVELKDDMKQGVISNFSARFKDDYLMASNTAVRESETVTHLKNAVFSPCKVCDSDPIWQVRSEDVKIDTEDQKVTHKNAFMEFFGMPFFYTPYISHATPGADRKSGFMIPSYTNIDTLGSIVKVPYYWSIAPNMDATITPIYTSIEGNVLHTEFRHMIESGDYQIMASITEPDKRDDAGNKTSGQQIRSHIEGFGQFDIDDEWDWGFSGKRSSDDTYLRRYRFGDEDLLTTKAYVQQVAGDDYLGAEMISFQGLNADDDPGATPLILPLANSHLQTERGSGWMGSHWSLDSNLMAVHRDEGAESRRISTKATWELPYTTKGGHVFKAKTSLRGDGYDVNNVPDPTNPNNSQEGVAGRAIPEAELDWSWPLARSGEKVSVLLEPVVQLIVSPHGNNLSKIPNEDSQEVELSDMNLFSNNHFAGIDLVEGGPRTNYGFQGLVHTAGVGDVSFLFGQNYRTKKDSSFSASSGLDKNFSDYVGRIGLATLKDAVNVNYRFRLDRQELNSKRSEIDSSFVAGPLSFSVGYISLSEGTTDDPLFNREEVTSSATLKLIDDWSLTGNIRRDLSDSGGFINGGAGLIFDNKCLLFSLNFDRDFTSDRDIRPSESFTLRLIFRGLN